MSHYRDSGSEIYRNVFSFRCLSVFFSVCLLCGCEGGPWRDALSSRQQQDFTLNMMAKTDTNMVFDLQVKTLHEHLHSLMLKLYLRNPAYWRQPGIASAEEKIKKLYSVSDYIVSHALNNTRSVESIKLAFLPEFSGDRVLAFVFGLRTMLDDAYGGRQEFFMLDTLDPQKLYNAARNLEVAAWLLSTERMPDGRLFLVSNELEGEVKNLSFERLFGKMIAIQDANARIVANSTNRVIKNVLQGVARFVFLPI